MQQRQDNLDREPQGVAREEYFGSSFSGAVAIGFGVGLAISVPTVFINYAVSHELARSSLMIALGGSLGSGVINGAATIFTGRDLIARGVGLIGRFGGFVVGLCRDYGRQEVVAGGEPAAPDGVATGIGAPHVVAEGVRNWIELPNTGQGHGEGEEAKEGRVGSGPVRVRTSAAVRAVVPPVVPNTTTTAAVARAAADGAADGVNVGADNNLGGVRG